MSYIYLTVDVECHDIDNVNQYIYGNYKKGQCGLKRILELGKSLGIPVNFFFDVGEVKRYGEGYVNEIIEMIKSYGQPVWFHLHPNYISGDDNRTYLWEYDKDEQKKIFAEGLEIYEKYCGKTDKLVFRAGRYGVDENFYSVLGESGKNVIDLSFFYGNMKMCRLPAEIIDSKNRIVEYKNVCLLPNTSYIGFDYFGKKSTFLLNCANTTFDEFKTVISDVGLNNVVYTMHSWDLMKKWFFRKKTVSADKYVEKRFLKCVKFARKKGFTFANLENLDRNLNEKDEVINCCKGFKGKVKGLLNNFIRFWIIGRLNKKYFLLYLIFGCITALSAAALILILILLLT